MSTVLSLIPFCTPLIMYLRISLIDAAGLADRTLHRASCWPRSMRILWVASRIYRVGILMYGKKPSLPEILRWLKYS